MVHEKYSEGNPFAKLLEGEKIPLEDMYEQSREADTAVLTYLTNMASPMVIYDDDLSRFRVRKEEVEAMADHYEKEIGSKRSLPNPLPVTDIYRKIRNIQGKEVTYPEDLNTDELEEIVENNNDELIEQIPGMLTSEEMAQKKNKWWAGVASAEIMAFSSLFLPKTAAIVGSMLGGSYMGKQSFDTMTSREMKSDFQEALQRRNATKISNSMGSIEVEAVEPVEVDARKIKHYDKKGRPVDISFEEFEGLLSDIEKQQISSIKFAGADYDSENIFEYIESLKKDSEVKPTDVQIFMDRKGDTTEYEFFINADLTADENFIRSEGFLNISANVEEDGFGSLLSKTNISSGLTEELLEQENQS